MLFKKNDRYQFLTTPVISLLCLVGLLTVGFGLFKGTTADAAIGINQRLNFQGRFFGATGAVLPDGNYNVEFKIVQDGDGCNPTSGTFPCGGTTQWTETRTGSNRVTIKNGYFSVELGSVTGLPITIWDQDILWLSVNMGGTGDTPTWDGEMKPLKRLSSSPYSFNSKLLDGLAKNDYVQLAQGVQTDSSNSNVSIAINKTGSAALLQLQQAGLDVFALDNSGSLAATYRGTATAALFDATNSSANGLSVDVQSSSTSQYSFKVTSGNGTINAFYVRADGSVGIGTTTPNTTLQVVSTTAGAIVQQLQLSNSSIAANTGTGIDFNMSTSNTFVNASIRSQRTGTADGNLQFHTHNGSSLGERWRITNIGILQSNGTQIIQTSTGNLTLATAAGNGHIILSPHGIGNVGIGTTTPDLLGFGFKTLTIQGAATRSIVELSNTSTGTTGIAGTIAGLNGSTLLGSINITADGATNSGYIDFWTNSAGTLGEKMRITSNGNVGIGTTEPGSKLDVVGSFAPAGGVSSILNNISYTNASTNTSGTSSVIGLKVSGVINAAGLGGVHVSAGISVGAMTGTPGVDGTQVNQGISIANQGLSGSEVAYGLYVANQTGSGVNYAAVFEGGNIGIGKTDPTSPLHLVSTNTAGTLFNITDSTAITAALIGQSITLSGSGAFDQTGLQFNLSGATGTNLNDIVGTGNSWKISKTGALTVASCTGCGAGGATALHQITNATGSNTLANANNAQTWNWGTLTTQTGLSLGGGAAMTTGGVFAVNTGSTYIHTTAETGNLVQFGFTDASTNASGNSVTSGLNISSVINTSGAGTKDIEVLNISAPTITACITGACTWEGVEINTQANTNSLVTQHALSIVTTGTSTAGAINGLNIGNITAGAAIEKAINIGTGWDYGIIFNDTTSAIQLGATDNTAELAIWDSAPTPNKLLEIKDLSTNFGSALSAGAFIDNNSYSGQEFAADQTDATADSVVWGDDQGWVADEQAATTGDCVFSIVDDIPNGIHQQVNSTINTTCSTYQGLAAANLQMTYDADNLPVVLMKMKPSHATVTDDFWVGLQNQTQIVVNDEPDQGIFFTNDNGTNWVGVAKTADGTRSTAACGVAVSTTQFALLKIEVRSTTDVRFFIDANVSDGISWISCGTVSTNVPTAALGSMLKHSSTLTARNIQVDFFRVWQDDSAPVEFGPADSDSTQPLEIEAGETTPFESRVALMELMAGDEAAETDIGIDLFTTERLVAGLEIITPEITADTVHVNTIRSATEEGIMIQLGESRSLVINTEDKKELFRFDDKGNALFVGTITADKIRANQVEGLEILADHISSLEQKINDQSLSASSEAQSSETLESDTEPVEQFNKPVTMISLTVLGQLEAQGGLVVAGLVRFDGQATFAALAEFYGKVMFNEEVTFGAHTIFGRDAGGAAKIKQGTDRVEVLFEQPYTNTPTVVATLKAEAGAEQILLKAGYSYLITNITNKGFSIVLNKPALQDISLDWLATSIKNAKITESTTAIEETNANSQTPTIQGDEAQTDQPT